MNIRSQDNKYIITDLNLEVVTNTDFKIKKISFDNDCQEISGDEVTKSKIYSSTGLMIGEYSTEEKAIKVLDMIQIAYEEANSVCSMSGFVANTVFQMPTDKEV